MLLSFQTAVTFYQSTPPGHSEYLILHNVVCLVRDLVKAEIISLKARATKPFDQFRLLLNTIKLFLFLFV